MKFYVFIVILNILGNISALPRPWHGQSTPVFYRTMVEDDISEEHNNMPSHPPSYGLISNIEKGDEFPRWEMRFRDDDSEEDEDDGSSEKDIAHSDIQDSTPVWPISTWPEPSYGARGGLRGRGRASMPTWKLTDHYKRAPVYSPYDASGSGGFTYRKVPVSYSDWRRVVFRHKYY